MADPTPASDANTGPRVRVKYNEATGAVTVENVAPASDAERATEILCACGHSHRLHSPDPSMMPGCRATVATSGNSFGMADRLCACRLSREGVILSERAPLVKRVEYLEAELRHAIGISTRKSEELADRDARIEALTRAITEAAESENALISTGAKLIQQRVAPASPDASDGPARAEEAR